MNILITGANGLLATNIIKELIYAQVTVTGFLRDQRKFLLPVDERLTLIEGDITNSNTLSNAMAGCTHIIHAAAMTNQGERKYEKYYQANASATKKLVHCALEHNIKRIVFVSTANTLGYGTYHNPGTEEQPMQTPFTKSFYAQSKRAAEQILSKYQNEIDIVTVHPTFMLGAYDGGPGSGQLITRVCNKPVIFYPPGGKNFIHVQDAAKAIIKILQQGKRGENYLVANENLSYYDFFKKVNVITGRKPRMIPLPEWLLGLVGFTGDALRAIGITTALSSANMKILCTKNYYSNAKIKNQFQLEFKSIDHAIDDAIKWFKANDLLKILVI